MKRKRVGLLGGTFNPIHFGHLNLALEIQEKRDLEEVWFIPSLLSPLRTHEALISPEHRLNMLALALGPVPGFQICPVELERPPPSYTIDTIKEIVSLYPEPLFHLILGEDSLIRFQEWKEPDEIVRLLPLLIGSRRHSELESRFPSLGLSQEITEAIRKGLVATRQLEISASEVRERLKKRLYCGHFLPLKVLDYICANQLYFNALT